MFMEKNTIKPAFLLFHSAQGHQIENEQRMTFKLPKDIINSVFTFAIIAHQNYHRVKHTLLSSF